MNIGAITVIVVYLIINIASVIISSIKQKTASASQFIAAHNTNPWWMVMLSALGVTVAGGSVTAVFSSCYSQGFSGAWVNWGAALSLLICTTVTIKMFRVMAFKYGHNTSSGTVSVFFSERNATLNSVIFIVFYLVAFCLQPKAAASVIVPITGWNVDVVTWVSGIVFILVAVLGGAGGVVWVTAINSVIMIISLFVMSTMSIHDAGGFGAILSSVPETYTNPFYPDARTVLAVAFTNMLLSCFLSNNATIAFSAKNAKHAYVGFACVFVLLVLLGFSNAFSGMAAYVLDPNMDINSAVMGLAGKFSPFITGFVGCGILAAIVSSGPGGIMAVANHFSEDIYLKFINPKADNKTRIRVVRIAAIVFGIIGIGISYASPSLIVFVYAAAQILAPTNLVMLATLVWKRIDSRAAFWSILFGSIVGFVWFVAGNPFGVNAFWPSFAVTAVVLIPLTLAAKEPVSEGHKRYIEAKAEYEKAQLD